MHSAIAAADIDGFYAQMAKVHTIMDASILQHASKTCASFASSRILRASFQRSVHILGVLCERFPHATFECVFHPYEPPIMSSLANYVVSLYSKYPLYAHDAQVAAVLEHLPAHQTAQMDEGLTWTAVRGMRHAMRALLAKGGRFPPGLVQSSARTGWGILWDLSRLAPHYGLDAGNGNEDALLFLMLDFHQLVVVNTDPATSGLKALHYRLQSETPPPSTLRGKHPLVALTILLVESYKIDIGRRSFEGLTARDYVRRMRDHMALFVELQPNLRFGAYLETFAMTHDVLRSYELDVWGRQVHALGLAVRRPKTLFARLGADLVRNILEALRPAR